MQIDRLVKPNLRLVTIRTKNLTEMEDFYNKLLLKEPDQVEPDRLLEYEFNGVLLGLYNPEADESVDRNSVTKGDSIIPAFKLGEDYQYHKERIQEFVDLDYETRESGHKWFVFTDPDGNRIEMYRGSID